ncbi:phosphatase [bacterium]|nr:MAG: phosphatase [bacterium]
MLNEQKIDDKITIGGRPDAAELENLKARGFRTIINLLTEDEPNYGHEEQQVEDLGLDYSAVPVSPDLLDDLAVNRFSQAILSSDGPVAVHCKSGGRAGVMTLLHLAVSHGWSLEKTLEKAEEIGAKIGPDSPYREFFESYIKRHSAGER